MALPKHIREKIENVAIVIKQRPSGEELKKTGTRCERMLLGLYQGIPKTTWGRNFSGRLPDKITIFQKSIESLARSPEEITELIKYTVWHELAHHFGIKEKRIRSLEAKWRKKQIKR